MTTAIVLAALLAAGQPPPAEVVAETLTVQDLDGALILQGALHGADSDTTGPFLLDTGSGYLALDRTLCVALGLCDEDAEETDIAILGQAVPRLTLGARDRDQIAPALSIDLATMRAVTDQPILGLLGQSLFSDAALVLDDAHGRLIVVSGGGPGGADPIERSRTLLAPWLPRHARPYPFLLRGDGKVLLRGSLDGHDSLDWVLDTGATKSVLFASALAARGVRTAGWRALRGLDSPTVYGRAPTRLVRVRALGVNGPRGAAVAKAVDAALLDGKVADELVRVTGQPVHGLLGHSFLRRFQAVLDYPRRIVWLAPARVSRDERRWEYSTIGVQLERGDGGTLITGVADPSPAYAAGVRAGDRLLAVDGHTTRGEPLATLQRRLEGRPGSPVRIVVEHAGRRHWRRLLRRRLL